MGTALPLLLEAEPEQRPLMLVQNPGECVFMPSGWWHCVLNIAPTASVAVTQNLAVPINRATILVAAREALGEATAEAWARHLPG